LTPPGLALSRLFEKKLGISFTETDLPYTEKVAQGLRGIGDNKKPEHPT
jgi:hypothetical protein